MKKHLKFIVLLGLITLLLIHPGIGLALQPEDLGDHIAFIKKGEVWVIDRSDGDRIQLTRTGGKVESYIFSPGLEYLAYSRVLSTDKETGVFERGNDVHQEAAHSIVIENLGDSGVVTEITPTEGRSIYPARWLPGGKLLFYETSALDVSGFRTYQVRQKVDTELDYRQGVRFAEADYDRDGVLMVYVKQSGIEEGSDKELHLVDMTTGNDEILLKKRSILDIKLSHDKEAIAFVEVVDIGGESLDILWIYHIEEKSLNSLYRGPARVKESLRCELSWSPEDRYLAMLYSPETVVLEVAKPDNRQYIEGKDVAWINERQLAYSDGADICLFLLDKGEKARWIKGGLNPVFLP